jgi:CheY-like chemotaxis protein
MGTSIKLYLPCTDAEVDRVMLQKGGAVPRGTERVLVVEDEPRVRASVVEQLRSLGYVVFQAEDGDAGLALMESTVPAVDLMLTDIMMPGLLNGKALADVVERRWPKTKVIFMSGFSELSIVQYGRLDDGVLLLSKPFRKGDLARILRQALDAPGAAQLSV